MAARGGVDSVGEVAACPAALLLSIYSWSARETAMGVGLSGSGRVGLGLFLDGLFRLRTQAHRTNYPIIRINYYMGPAGVGT